jgi:hypothetical protein
MFCNGLFVASCLSQLVLDGRGFVLVVSVAGDCSLSPLLRKILDGEIAIVISTTPRTTNNKQQRRTTTKANYNCHRSAWWKHWWQSWALLKHPLLISVQGCEGQQYSGQPETTSCWIDDFKEPPEGCTSQHECSFVEVDVEELYLIRVIQYMTFVSIVIPGEVEPFATSAYSVSERLLPVCTNSSSANAEKVLLNAFGHMKV